MLKKSLMVGLALSVGLLVGCEPQQQEGQQQQQERQQQEGAGGGGPAAVVPQEAGEHYEQAYTKVAETHANALQRDWRGARDSVRDARENLDAMRDDEKLSQSTRQSIDELRQSVAQLEQQVEAESADAVRTAHSLVKEMADKAQISRLGEELWKQEGQQQQQKR